VFVLRQDRISVYSFLTIVCVNVGHDSVCGMAQNYRIEADIVGSKGIKGSKPEKTQVERVAKNCLSAFCLSVSSGSCPDGVANSSTKSPTVIVLCVVRHVI
jgi:hypothetical protein